MRTTALRSTILITLLVLALQAFTGTLCAQIRHDYRNIDQRALGTPPEAEVNLTRLVDYLTENVYEDRNKVRAIYRWIADRIAYDIHALNNPPDTWPSPDEVLYRRKAVCTGYAVLFDEMSRIAGLETELIVGHSKGLGTLNAGKTDFTPNHVWNAVKVDGHWSLIDATWGAGYITSGGFFIPAFNDFYFMADPVKIVYTHLPEDPDWQLLVNPVSMKQYREHVWVRVPFFRHRLSVISHREAEITSYGELQIRLGVPGDVVISAALKFDGNPLHGNHIINYGGSDAQIDMSLNLRGTYTLEVYAREKESADDRLELAMIYNINNTQTPVASRMLARQYGRFLTSRGNLISPRQYLLDEGQHQFDIVIPGARDVFVVNNKKMTALHRQGDRFYGTVPVIGGDLRLAARFSGQDLDILVEYMVAM